MKKNPSIRKVLILIVLVCFISSSLTACYDAYEIDDWAFVFSIGIDKGVSDKLRITVQIPTLKGGESGTGGGGGQSSTASPGTGNFAVISQDCPSFYTGVNMINTSLSRKINYSHAGFLIISEEMAREDISHLISSFVRDRQVRRIMHVIVVRGSSADFLRSFNPVLGTAISKTQEGMMNQEDETGYFDDNTLNEFTNDMKNSKKQPIAVLAGVNDFTGYRTNGPVPQQSGTGGIYYAGEVPRLGGNKNEFFGAAVFNGGRMVGELNGDETRALLMAKGDFKRASFAMPDPLQPDFTDTIDVIQSKTPKISVSFKGGMPVVKLKIFLDGDLQAIQTTVDYGKKNMKTLLESRFREYIKRELDGMIEKLKSFNTDSIGFGEKAAMHFPTIQAWEKYNWESRFNQVKVDTQVDFAIRRTGTILKANPEKTSEGTSK